VLCDSGNRYTSKLFNPAFLRSKGLPVPRWLERDPEATSARALLSEVLLAKGS
jgi:cysteine synthase A